jgi:predicted nucleic acid-binding protein
MGTRRVYFDSSLWISYILQENLDNRAQRVQQLIDQIKEDDEVILVSHLVLLEVLEVIRKRITQMEQYTSLDDNKKEEIKDKIQEKTNNFIEILYRLVQEHRVALVNSQESVDTWFKATYSIFTTSFGDISTYNSGGKGNNPPRYRYRGVGHYDIQHALTAKEYSARGLYTFDWGFAELQGNQEFEGIQFVIR